MNIKETSQKSAPNSKLKENMFTRLDISFTKIISDSKFGLPPSTDQTINDKIKVQKIVKTLMFIREKNPQELLQTKKTQQIGGCEKCDLDKWQWNEQKVKNYLKDTQRQIFILRAGDSRIFGSIYNNCFYIYAIEYNLNDIYKH